MFSPRYWPGFARSERRRRRCGRGGDGGVIDDGGGNGWAGRIVAAFQGREREEALEDRISRCWRIRVKICMRSPGTCRHMPSCTFWGWVLSDLTKGISTGTCSGLNAPSGAGCLLTARSDSRRPLTRCLNAPSGAGCFLTLRGARPDDHLRVLMHLLVLGAF